MVCFTAIWLNILSEWALSNLTRKDTTSSYVIILLILPDFYHNSLILHAVFYCDIVYYLV